MSISQKPLRSESGFASPGFIVDTYGNINITGDFKVNGVPVLGGTALPSTIVSSNLTSVGTLASLTVNGNTVLSNGSVTINSTSAVTITSNTVGSINNIAIGNTTPSTGAFTILSAVDFSNTGTVNISPTTLGSIDNVNIGYTTPGTGKFTSITITTPPINNTDATQKKYVDTRSIAMSIALGS